MSGFWLKMWDSKAGFECGVVVGLSEMQVMNLWEALRKNMGNWEPGKFRDEAVWGSHLCWTCSKIGYQFDKLDIECVLRFLNDNLII